MRRCVLQVVLCVLAAELMAMKQLGKKGVFTLFTLSQSNFVVFQGLFVYLIMFISPGRKNGSLAVSA